MEESQSHFEYQFSGERLDSHDFYAAYVFDSPEKHSGDIAVFIEEAGRLDYPVRYWWLSQVVDLRSAPDRLIVCAHHPAAGPDTGMDLYEAAKDTGVAYDELDSATVEEYAYFSRRLKTLADIVLPNGHRLFPDVRIPDAGDYLFALTRGNVQRTAQKTVGRFLTPEETHVVTNQLQEHIDALLVPLISFLASPTVDDSAELEEVGDYLVSYRLLGYALIAAASGQDARMRMIAHLDNLIENPPEAMSVDRGVRIGELAVAVDTVEAIVFQADDDPLPWDE